MRNILRALFLNGRSCFRTGNSGNGLNMPENDALFAFLSGYGQSYGQVYIWDVWDFSYEELESRHDYIQWLFPLKERSRFNTFAPIITDISPYKTYTIKENMQKSFVLMLSFYGFKICGDEIICSESFPERKENWVTAGNHNYLRITRILKSLMLFGLKKEAGMFLLILETVYEDNKDKIGEETMNYWEGAALYAQD